MSFLPISKKELKELNIESLDFIYISGDAYIDHPSFGVAIITRVVESQGFSIGVIPQPLTDEDYKKLGEPNIAFLVGSGVCDSMVNNYTVAKNKREKDLYSEGGKSGMKPDRALTVYCTALKRLFPNSPILVGGIEASLRRFAHYDYWSDKVLPSILCDTKADLLMFGMGERVILDILALVKRGVPITKIKDIEGTSYFVEYENANKKLKMAIDQNGNDDYIMMPSYEEVKEDKISYCKAFMNQYENNDNLNAQKLIQKTQNGYVVQNKPSRALTQEEMDWIYSLPYERTCHPIYKQGVPAIKEVEFSVTSQRGCFGNCSFCAINYHQGRRIQNRSQESILKEVELLTKRPNFKGYIHDIGGPSANFYKPSCDKQLKYGVCKNKNCIGKERCPNLKVDHSEYLEILRKASQIKNVKKVFVRSGIRFDYILYDKDKTFFKELCKNHISGLLKIAPEHICNNVLDLMNKPSNESYFEFQKMYYEENKIIDKKQYIVPYLISSHPGSTLKNAIEMAEYLKSINHIVEQVQDFYPTPSTWSTCMYHTGYDPRTMEKVYVPKTKQEKNMQRALLQFSRPENYALVYKALTLSNRSDLIGFDKKCLIKPYKPKTKK